MAKFGLFTSSDRLKSGTLVQKVNHRYLMSLANTFYSKYHSVDHLNTLPSAILNIHTGTYLNLVLDNRKISVLKKGNRDRKRKACKQVRDQKVWK